MHKISSENNRSPNQLEVLRAEQRAPPPGEDICEEDADFNDDEEEEEETPRVIINPLTRIFNFRAPSISLQEIEPDDAMGERFNVEWLDYCRENY